MTWYEQQMDAKLLSRKRRPKGDDVTQLQAGVLYRKPLDNLGHYVRPSSFDHAPEFYCGRSVYYDPDTYVSSGAEARYGPWYVVVDTRKDSACADCKRWRAKNPYDTAKPTLEEIVDSSPFTADEVGSIGLAAQLERRKVRQSAFWLFELLDAKIVEEAR